MKIGTKDLRTSNFVIAEIGNNHEGDMTRAEMLIKLAAQAGADAVKFQAIQADLLVPPAQTERRARLKKWELSRKDYEKLAAVAHDHGVLFMATAFYLGAVDWLDPLVPAHKIASGDLDFYPLIDKIAAQNKPVFLSTGGADFSMVAASAARLRHDNLILLQTILSYPAAMEDIHLETMTALTQLSLYVGYSDHVPGIGACLAALQAGACVIEKHFTDDTKRTSQPDAVHAADPVLLAELTATAKQPRGRLPGQGEKKLLPSETALANSVRRIAYAARDLPAGHILTDADISWLRGERDGSAIPASETVIGERLKEGITAGEPIRKNILQINI